MKSSPRLRRFYPVHCQEVRVLSELLERYLQFLADSPLQCSLSQLSQQAGVAAATLQALSQMHRTVHLPDDLTPKDFHLVFAHLMFRYPTVKMYRAEPDGHIFFEA